jgi:hypothetical protein
MLTNERLDTMRRLEQGWFLLAALGDDAETVELCAPLAKAQDALDDARARRVEELKAATQATAHQQVKQKRLQQTIRSVWRRAAEVDGRPTAGPLQRDLFPEGLTPALPVGASAQLVAAQELVTRLERSDRPHADALRSAWREPLAQMVDTFRTAVLLRASAHEKLGHAWDWELRARAGHCDECHRIGGALRMRFPRDRDRQAMFWPPRHRPSILDEADAEVAHVSVVTAPTASESKTDAA